MKIGRKIPAAALLALSLWLPFTAEASVTTVEQKMGRTEVQRPVVEGLREEAFGQMEQSLDGIICRLAAEAEKKEGATGRFSYQVVSENDFYVSLLLTGEIKAPKEKKALPPQVFGVLYEKNHGARVTVEEMLGSLPEAKQLEELKQRDGMVKTDGTGIAPEECGKIKRVPQDFVLAADGLMYLVFQPGELAAVEQGPLL